VLGKLRIAGGDQRQHLHPRIGHVGCGVQPVFKKEEQAEYKASRLTLREEICGQ